MASQNEERPSILWAIVPFWVITTSVLKLFGIFNLGWFFVFLPVIICLFLFVLVVGGVGLILYFSREREK